MPLESNNMPIPDPDDLPTTGFHLEKHPSAMDRVPDDDTDVGSVGRYRLERVLGTGGFGKVYLAYDEELHRRVAVKIPHQRRITCAVDIEAYLTEARVVAGLDHPAIVPVYDFGRTADERCFIVTKYIDGVSLAFTLSENVLPRETGIPLIVTIAEALHHAHLHGVVHRDVKPGNILLDADGNPFLTDFGLALRDEDLGSGPQFIGTACYMSPEQARGEGHRVDGRSDVFSLCIVLYQILTGRRPFQHNSQRQLLEMIKSVEPRPLRQLDDTIPRELERICLRGLANRVSDRYSTARDLADDLAAFLRDSHIDGLPPRHAPARSFQVDPASLPSDLRTRSQMIPKGLRAYDAEDADFFLELLPGPYNRHGLPRQLLFWKQRIESTDPEISFPTGVMYGPSGCGKSSFVRAGLLPTLADHVRAIFCEADATATESRLLNRLRFYLPELPADAGLRDCLALIRRQPEIARGKKVLIVLDQFEQWLHGRREAGRDELVDALRQCDGKVLSCLILVRDDFWLAVSRFLRDIEIPLHEGRNSALVDLFGKRHARKVLFAMGQAFGAFSNARLDEQDMTFLDRVVDGLAEEDRIVCVRLALFAETMKSRPWTCATLDAVGGVKGIGVRFLEEAFGTSAAPPEYRLHAPAARRVLESLLPEEGLEIKGGKQSFDDLLRVSGYGNRPHDFQALLRILDRELRLMTPADVPDDIPSEMTECAPDAGKPSYQLTHDYLVPALREWLKAKRSRTLSGRAELCLAERTRQWQTYTETRQLPSWWEWLRIRWLTRPNTWSEPQRQLMRAADRRHLVRIAAWCVVVVAFSLVSLIGYARYHAANCLDRLLAAETTDVLDIADELTPYVGWVRPRLIAARTDADPKRQLHASLALLPTDAGQAAFLKSRLLTASPAECRVIADALKQHHAHAIDTFFELMGDTTLSASTRLRLAVALARWTPDDVRWSEHAENTAIWLVSENSLLLGEWYELLRPVRRWLVGPLRQLYDHSERLDIKRNTLTVLSNCWRNSPRQLIELAQVTRVPELAVLATALRVHKSKVTSALRDRLEYNPEKSSQPTVFDKSTRGRVNAALLLCLLDADDTVWPELKLSAQPDLRTALVHGFAAAGVDPNVLIQRLDVERDPSIRRAILWSLAKYEGAILTHDHRDVLIPRLRRMYCDDPDPGIHSSAEYLLRRWGRLADLADANETLSDGRIDPIRGWFQASQGQMLAIIHGPIHFQMGSPTDDPVRHGNEWNQDATIDYDYAIAAKEVSRRQFAQFRPDWLDGVKTDEAMDAATDRVSLLDAMAYCRWLSQTEGLSEEDMCYVPDETGSLQVHPDWLKRSGYRLPTEKEWEYACRAGTISTRFFGNDSEILDNYAWFSNNSHGHSHPSGLLLPNDFGLFDLYGNQAEWCQDLFATSLEIGYQLDKKDFMHATRGGGYRVNREMLRSASRVGIHRNSKFTGVGLRIARTIRWRSAKPASP